MSPLGREWFQLVNSILDDPSAFRRTMTHPTPFPYLYDEPTGECRKSAESATKPRLELLPGAALEQIAEVLTYGAAKYGPTTGAVAPAGAGTSRPCSGTSSPGGAARTWTLKPA